MSKQQQQLPDPDDALNPDPTNPMEGDWGASSLAATQACKQVCMSENLDEKNHWALIVLVKNGFYFFHQSSNES